MQDSKNVDCPRCGGTGYLSQFAHVEGGVCFYCRGKGAVALPCVRTPVTHGKLIRVAGRAAWVTRHEQWFRFEFELGEGQASVLGWATVNEQGRCGAAVLGARASTVISVAEFRAGVEAAYRGTQPRRVVG